MTTTANIELGLKMIKSHDFLWYMVESNYLAAEANAKADMRRFVEFLSTCTREEAATLRAKWIEAYNATQEAISKAFRF